MSFFCCYPNQEKIVPEEILYNKKSENDSENDSENIHSFTINFENFDLAFADSSFKTKFLNDTRYELEKILLEIEYEINILLNECIISEKSYDEKESIIKIKLKSMIEILDLFDIKKQHIYNVDSDFVTKNNVRENGSKYVLIVFKVQRYFIPQLKERNLGSFRTSYTPELVMNKFL